MKVERCTYRQERSGIDVEIHRAEALYCGEAGGRLENSDVLDVYSSVLLLTDVLEDEGRICRLCQRRKSWEKPNCVGPTVVIRVGRGCTSIRLPASARNAVGEIADI